MPNRYWVGGTASWDGTPGTKWAATSGGVGGASIPGPNDDVFFDAASTGTVTIAAINNGARSINCTGFAGTITGTGGLTVGGSITLSAGMTYSHTGTITIAGTATLTTAGKAFSALIIDGPGITVTLGDALNTVTRNITLTQGTFTTNNFTLTCGNFASNNTNVRAINLGASTINANNFVANNSTNLTFNAGTSQINIVSGTGAINVGSTAGSGVTFHNVTFSAVSSVSRSIFGSHTFNNLTIDNPDANASKIVIIGANQTVNGALTCAGSSIFRRVLLRSDTPGIARTITASSISANDCDFSSITIAGAAAGASPTRAGDCGGNSGLTFPAAKTVYRVGGSTSWSGVNSWALSSGGAGADANFPLPQDTAIIDNSATTGITLQIEPYNIGTLDASARTNAITINHGTAINICGSYRLGSGTAVSGVGSVSFIGPGTSTISCAGRTLTFSILILSLSCVFSLADAFSNGAGNFVTLNAGTINTNNFNFTTNTINSSTVNSRTINLGSSTVTLNGNGFSGLVIDNWTINAGTSQINFASTTNAGPNLLAKPFTFHNVSFTFPATFPVLEINGSFTFNNLTIAAPVSGTRTCQFSGNQTVNGTLTCAGTSITGRVALVSNTNAVRTLTVAAISANNCDFRDITLAGAAAGAAPTNAGDCGNNSGIVFPAPKTVYRVGTNTSWSGANSWALSSGGTGLTANFPLPQDTAVIDNNTTLATTLFMGATFNIGTINMSARTNALTINIDSVTYFTRSFILGSGMTATGSFNPTFTARSGFADFTSAGKTIGFPIEIATFGATFRILDALTASSFVRLTAGTFDFNGFNVACLQFESQNSNQRTLSLGASTLTITGSVFAVLTPANFTLAGSGTISLTSAAAKSFNGAGATYPYTINNGGAGVLTIAGSNTITTLSNSVQPATFRFTSGTTTTLTNWNVSGTPGNLVTIDSINSGNITTPPVLSKSSGTVSANYLAITFSAAAGGASWYAGPNSVNNGVTSGWVFAAVPVVIAAMAASEVGSDTFAASVLISAAGITAAMAASEAGPDILAADAFIGYKVLAALAASETGPDTFAASAFIGALPPPVAGGVFRIELRSFTERRRF